MHILMVHGTAHDENCWNELTPYLIAHGFRVHTLTLRGHGRSQDSGYRISMSIYAKDVCHKAELIGRSRGRTKSSNCKDSKYCKNTRV